MSRFHRRSTQPSGLNAPDQPYVFAPPPGLITQPQGIVRTATFLYDPNGQPAFGVQHLQSGGHVSLLKGYNAALAALAGVDLAGLRMQFILIVDGSGSMWGLYQQGLVQQLMVRSLGFALNVDADGDIPVIVYGSSVNRPVMINLGNYQNAPQLIAPDFGGTDMTGGFVAAMKLAQSSTIPTMIVNITDGEPNDTVTMSNEIIMSSGQPVMVKNFAVAPVDYLEELDDLPSRHEIRKDANGKPVLDPQGMLILDENPSGIRFVDNVDSQKVDPFNDSDEEFAAKLAEEVGSCLEVWGRTGIVTGVPGVDRTIF